MAIYKRGRRFELGTTENKSSKWPEQDSNPEPPDVESDAPTTRPRCLVNGLGGVFLPSRIDVFLNLSYLLTILSRNKVLFKRFGYFVCSVKSSVVFISVCSMNCAASFDIHIAGFQCHSFQNRSK